MFTLCAYVRAFWARGWYNATVLEEEPVTELMLQISAVVDLAAVSVACVGGLTAFGFYINGLLRD